MRYRTSPRLARNTILRVWIYYVDQSQHGRLPTSSASATGAGSQGQSCHCHVRLNFLQRCRQYQFKKTWLLVTFVSFMMTPCCITHFIGFPCQQASHQNSQPHVQLCPQDLTTLKRSIKRHRPRYIPLPRNPRLFHPRNLFVHPIRPYLRHSHKHCPQPLRYRRKQSPNYARRSRRHNISILCRCPPYSPSNPLPGSETQHTRLECLT